MNKQELIEPVVKLAVEAGNRILKVYATDFEVQSKADESPLTQADLAAHKTIISGLKALTPDVPIISEEQDLPSFGLRRKWARYWLVDPLDGTREFVNRNGEFTVNIALIEQHLPVLGVVRVPAQQRTFVGCRGYGAERRVDGKQPKSIAVQASPHRPIRVVGSRSHRYNSLDGFLDKLGDHEFMPMGSSLKFCVLAEGGADIYPRFGPTSEWDTAAAQAVVVEAGGKVLELDGKPLSYNRKEDILNPHFMVVGAVSIDWLALLNEHG